MAKLKGLGRGLDALLSGTAETPGRESLQTIALDRIRPGKYQPRSRMDEASLDELAQSIKAQGVMQPILVRPVDANRFEIIAGERRWLAARRAGLAEVPALVREVPDQAALALALIENIQREDLNPVEEAIAYRRLGERDDLPQSEIARLVGKSRSHVANMQRLLALPAPVLDHLATGRLDMGHARALIGHPEAEALADRAVAEGLSVREVEKLARKGAAIRRQARAPRDPAQDADIAAVQNHLEEYLGLTVRIATDPDPRSGAVTIRYRTLDQLDLICQRLTGASI